MLNLHRRTLLRKFLASTVVIFIIVPSLLSASEFPQKPIRYIVPFTAGGLTDTMARIVGQKLSDTWKQPILIENRAGGNGNIGADAAAKSPNDGYTWLAITLTHAANQTLFPKSGYVLDKDFVAVAGLATSPLVVVVNVETPVRNLKELIELAKAKRLNAGSSGNGSPSHLGLALLQDATKTEIQHVPYKGGAQAITDLLGRQIDLIVANLPEAIAHINSGKLHPLAVSSKQRHPLLPDVPTMAEAGYPSVEVENWTGLVVPTGTPKPIIDKIAADALKTIRAADVRDKIAAGGFRLMGGSGTSSGAGSSSTGGLSPDEFQAYMKSEIQRWGTVIRTANIKPE